MLAEKKGRGSLWVTVVGTKQRYEFWLADIQDTCIVGLDLHTQLKATKDFHQLFRIDYALDHITGSSWYWQLAPAANAQPKTTFSIGQGLMSLANVPRSRCIF
ncbi:unnamed protein product [Arctogadus glacialis]